MLSALIRPGIVLACLFFALSLHAQDSTAVPPFSSPANSPGSEASAAPDSSIPDSLKVLPPPPSSGIEGPVRYRAENILFSLSDQTSVLSRNVVIEYQDISLTAGQVTIDWVHSTMTAVGIADTTDSLGHPVTRQLPVLTEKGEQPITGIRLSYDFKNNRGKVVEGKTEMAPGYYQGEDIRKVGESTLLVEDGYFTTCNHEQPHFYFRSKKMRMRVKKTAVARPVVLYIADVPLLAAPFAIFPLQRGRRSGIILPTYGENSFGGRYLQNFGYYMALSDYMDATLKASFYEKSGLNYDGQFRYKKRYSLNGNVNASYSPKDIRTGRRQERWRLTYRHTQEVSPTLKISGQGDFTSDKNYTRDYYTDYNNLTTQTLRANLNINKTLPGNRSLSIGLDRQQNLQTEQISYSLPNMTFNNGQRNLFPGRAKKANAPWYAKITYNYSNNLISSGSNNPVSDSTGEVVAFRDTRNTGWVHRLTPGIQFKLFKYFSVSPSLSYEELWVPEYQTYAYDRSTGKIDTTVVEGFQARRSVSNIGASVSTSIYGLWEIPFSPLKVIRHKMDPRIGISYSPDYSKESFGYYDTLVDSNGNTITANRFVKSPVGSGLSIGERRSLTFGLNNTFQGKYLWNEEEKKVDLFTMNFSSSYNSATKVNPLADLQMTFTSKIHPKLSISGGATSSFYKLDADNRKTEQLVWDGGFALPELLRWNVSARTGWTFQPSREKAEKPDTTARPDDLGFDNTNDPTDRAFGENPEGLFAGVDSPWRLQLNLDYS
nr:putative LPS assembly protein LptD [Calditrichia bacterium]